MLLADAKTLQSLGFILGVALLLGQFALRWLAGIPFDTLFLGITGVLILGPMFGPDFVVDLVKAVRGGRNDREGNADG
jgi:hypothetical protein